MVIDIVYIQYPTDPKLGCLAGGLELLAYLLRIQSILIFGLRGMTENYLKCFP